MILESILQKKELEGQTPKVEKHTGENQCSEAHFWLLTFREPLFVMNTAAFWDNFSCLVDIRPIRAATLGTNHCQDYGNRLERASFCKDKPPRR